MDIELKIKSMIRNIVDFSVKGVVFKDITPILKYINLFNIIKGKVISAAFVCELLFLKRQG